MNIYFGFYFNNNFNCNEVRSIDCVVTAKSIGDALNLLLLEYPDLDEDLWSMSKIDTTTEDIIELSFEEH